MSLNSNIVENNHSLVIEEYRFKIIDDRFIIKNSMMFVNKNYNKGKVFLRDNLYPLGNNLSYSYVVIISNDIITLEFKINDNHYKINSSNFSYKNNFDKIYEIRISPIIPTEVEYILLEEYE